MFAILALAGDVGCSAGPGLVGVVSNQIQNRGTGFLSAILKGADMTQVGLKTGLLAAIIFPLILITGVRVLRKKT